MNKKGAEMTIGTIVIIVLALIVLVVVALGFTTGWRNLWDKVNVFSGGKTLATLAQSCSIACESGDINGWCYIKRDYKDEKGELQRRYTCSSLALAAKISDCSNADVKCDTVGGGPIGYSIEEIKKICEEACNKEDISGFCIVDRDVIEDGRAVKRNCRELVDAGKVGACAQITCP